MTHSAVETQRKNSFWLTGPLPIWPGRRTSSMSSAEEQAPGGRDTPWHGRDAGSGVRRELQQRRSLASIFSSRRVSSAGKLPTLIVNDELQPDGVDMAAMSYSRNNSSVLGSPTLHARFDLRRGRLASGANSKDQPKLSCSQRVKKAVFSKTTAKLLIGLVLSALFTVCWVTAMTAIRLTYSSERPLIFDANSSLFLRPLYQTARYDAPFLTTWFCTAWLCLLYPIYSLWQCIKCRSKEEQSATGSSDAVRYFRNRGLTLGQFSARALMFCMLWVMTGYLQTLSMRVLSCTDVLALHSTSVGFVYLLSWVVLHEQFVGARIVAVIMCNTGVALLAYMDGVSRTPTLGSVLMAAASAAGTATYKVFFRKLMPECGPGAVCLFISLVGLLSTLLLWPIWLAVTAMGSEIASYDSLPWLQLNTAGLLILLCNMMMIFGCQLTYDFFVNVGLILAVPLSAAVDRRWFDVSFEGMHLAGIVLMVCGFFLVLFPTDWPSYIRALIRWGRRHSGSRRHHQPEPVDYRTGVISRSHLRSPSGHVR